MRGEGRGTGILDFMNHLYLLADLGSDLAANARSTGERFGWDTSHFIAQCISFCIVALCLYLFAYKPILKVLDERRKRIAEGLANADKIKAELARTEAQRLETLNQANSHAT